MSVLFAKVLSATDYSVLCFLSKRLSTGKLGSVFLRVYHQTDTPKHSDTSKIVPNTTQTSRTKSQQIKTTTTAFAKASTGGGKRVKESKPRNSLHLQKRVKLINYAKNNPNAGYRKVSDKFGKGLAQA